MPVILDPALKALMAKEQSAVVLWQDAAEGRTALLVKAADEDITSFRGRVRIRTRWELGRLVYGSVLRFYLVILDQPDRPYRLETFINVASPEQLACVERLLTQRTLHLHFFDRRTEHVLTKRITNPNFHRRQLRTLILQAQQDQEHLGQLWDFDRAKALFQARRPL